jgi:hypothetical protein
MFLASVQLGAKNLCQIRWDQLFLLSADGWTTFLVKVHNPTGITETIDVDSPEAAMPYDFSRMGRAEHL